MEANGHGRKGTVLACEFLGTAFFIFGIMMTNLPITIPFSLLASVVIWGDITGGHFNPAVTIGVFVSRKQYAEDFLFMALIMIAQICGGFFAIALAWAGLYDNPDPKIAVLAPYNPATDGADNISDKLDFTMDLNVVINEVICTFIFISVILMVKGQHTAGDRVGVGAAMCVVVTLMCVIAGTNKFGSCFNPAVGIALTTNQILFMGKQHYLYHYLYAYTLGPALGGLCAGIFHLFHAPLHEDEDVTEQFDASQREKLVHAKGDY